jgi:hypothetical protein
MIDQQATIDGPTGRTSLGLGAITSAWRFRLVFMLICAGAGLLSVMLGPDNYWDLRYYHLYAPWAYLHHRYLYDIGPAQEQSFYNPVADLLFYGLICSPLNEAPRVIAFIMGAVHGINAALLFGIVCEVVRPVEAVERMTLRAVAWLIGVSGAGFISLLGTATNDLTSALFVLASLYGLVRVAGHQDGGSPWRGFAAAGLWAGLGIGLKFTNAPFAPGLGAVVLLAAFRRRTVSGVIAYGGVAAVAFFAVAGHHMFTLWRDFGNPTFPYLNQIFHSPYFEPIAIRDDRFIPPNLWQLIIFPFRWTVANTYIVVEPAIRDWRAAIAWVAAAVALLALAMRHLRGRHRATGAPAPSRGFSLIVTFAAVSYFSWALGFGYYRYAVPLEMLTGVVTVGALTVIFEQRRFRIVAALAALAITASTTVYMDWSRIGHGPSRLPYGDRYIDVEVPPLPDNGIVLIATWDPVAFFIPYANPAVQYLGIENNYLELSQNNKFATEVKRLMREPGRPKFVLNVDAFNPEKLNALLAHFGLKLSTSPCAPIRTNLIGHDLSLCPIATN